ncbi:RidA family protein [Rubinisphaera margarita]|uniref:RidA family protein n=1 Tax=Rubinisphaera margarita TaxID=2909586 RepID=UPI001EE96116|nr:RidA family protein [Rubinisphaera margarita]MCG6156158.1 RidA family protein [Rubinisphaera margarita]
MTQSISETLASLGLQLPSAPDAVGAYVPVLRSGHLVMTSGQLPTIGKEVAFQGQVGHDLTREDGRNAAEVACLNALAQIAKEVGGLENVKRVVRLEGFVQSAAGFYDQPYVMNGASELLLKLFGDAGKHTRFAIGCNTLPLNAAVELALWAEV